MSDWKPIEQLSDEDQQRARGLFAPEEIARLGDYEFSDFGRKLLRRVKPELVKTTTAPGRPGKKPPGRSPEIEGGPSTSLRMTAEGRAENGVEQIVRAPLGQIVESPLNPREHYDAGRLQELAGSIRESGVIQPLIVRGLEYRATPDGITNLWHLDYRATGAEWRALDLLTSLDPDLRLSSPLSEEEARIQIGHLPRVEIVAGHRRKRAAGLAGIADVPVIVRALTDQQVLITQLIENLQREDLNPIEEAGGFQQMLSQKDAAGASLYTREKLAREINKSVEHIGERLSLLRLPGNAAAAIANARIGPAIGYLIARVPSDAMRKRLTAEVLKGFGDESGPMSKRDVLDHIRRHYVKQLRDVPFDRSDARLVPVKLDPDGQRRLGGDCDSCPFNSANMPEGRSQKFHFCTLPPCYLAKVEAHIEVVKDKALAAGAIVVESEIAHRYIQHDGVPKHESGYIDLNAKPHPGEVVSQKEAPAWREMVKGAVKIKPTVVFDEKGKEHWLAPRKLVIEAAKKNGFGEMFTAAASRSKSSPPDAGQVKRKAGENAASKLASAVGVRALEALVVEISKRGVGAEAWPALLEIALFHSGEDALGYLINRRGLTDGDDREKIVRASARKLEAARLPALVIELLLAGWMKLKGAEAPGFAALAVVYQLDLPAIRAAAKAALGEKAKPKAKPGKPERPIREMIAESAHRHGLTTMASIDALAKKECGKRYDFLKGNELTALLEAIKALPPAKKKGGAK